MNNIKEAQESFNKVNENINTAIYNLYIAKQTLIDLHNDMKNKEKKSLQINEIIQIVIWSLKYVDVSIKTTEDMKHHIDATSDDLNRI